MHLVNNGVRWLRLLASLRPVLLAAIATHFAATPAHAIDEIQVYNADIAPVGTFTLQQHLNYVWRGSTTPDFPGGIAPDRTLNGTRLRRHRLVRDRPLRSVYRRFRRHLSAWRRKVPTAFRVAARRGAQSLLRPQHRTQLSDAALFGERLRSRTAAHPRRARPRLGIHHQSDRRCGLRTERFGHFRASTAARTECRRRRHAGSRILYGLRTARNFRAGQQPAAHPVRRDRFQRLWFRCQFRGGLWADRRLVGCRIQVDHRPRVLAPGYAATITLPTQFLQSPAGIPDLGHVPDLVAVELHRIDVVRFGALAGRRRATLSGMRAGEYRKGRDVVSFGIHGERLQVVAAVGHDFHQALHPVGVLLERADLSQRLGLTGKRCVGLAVRLARLPTLALFAGVEELCGDGGDG